MSPYWSVAPSSKLRWFRVPATTITELANKPDTPAPHSAAFDVLEPGSNASPTIAAIAPVSTIFVNAVGPALLC